MDARRTFSCLTCSSDLNFLLLFQHDQKFHHDYSPYNNLTCPLSNFILSFTTLLTVSLRKLLIIYQHQYKLCACMHTFLTYFEGWFGSSFFVLNRSNINQLVRNTVQSDIFHCAAQPGRCNWSVIQKATLRARQAIK